MNENALTIQENNTIIELNAEDIKKYIAPKATDKELFMFINMAKSYNLNPFKREIHFVKYGDKPGEIIVGYETYIKRAEETGQLDGWRVWLEKDNIGEKAVIEIYRKDRKHPIVWEAYRSEFDKNQSTWKSMPYFMLKKTVISQGFRLAFPLELGGMPYTPDEIGNGRSEALPKEEENKSAEKDQYGDLGKAFMENISDDLMARLEDIDSDLDREKILNLTTTKMALSKRVAEGPKNNPEKFFEWFVNEFYELNEASE